MLSKLSWFGDIYYAAKDILKTGVWINPDVCANDIKTINLIYYWARNTKPNDRALYMVEKYMHIIEKCLSSEFAKGENFLHFSVNNFVSNNQYAIDLKAFHMVLKFAPLNMLKSRNNDGYTPLQLLNSYGVDWQLLELSKIFIMHGASLQELLEYPGLSRGLQRILNAQSAERQQATIIQFAAAILVGSVLVKKPMEQHKNYPCIAYRAHRMVSNTTLKIKHIEYELNILAKILKGTLPQDINALSILKIGSDYVANNALDLYLMYCIKFGYFIDGVAVDVAEYLLENIDFEVTEETIKTAIKISPKLGDLFLVQPTEGINSFNKYGLAAIHIACIKGDMGVVEKLINDGANLNLHDLFNVHPTQWVLEDSVYKTSKICADIFEKLLLSKNGCYFNEISLSALTTYDAVRVGYACIKSDYLTIMHSF